MTRALDRAAARYASAVAKQTLVRDELADQVREAIAGGMSEVEAARRAGVTRVTVRKWIGKNNPTKGTP